MLGGTRILTLQLSQCYGLTSGNLFSTTDSVDQEVLNHPCASGGRNGLPYPHATSLLLPFHRPVLSLCDPRGFSNACALFAFPSHKTQFCILWNSFKAVLSLSREKLRKKSSTLEVREKARLFLSSPGSKLRTFSMSHLNILHFNTDEFAIKW